MQRGLIGYPLGHSYSKLIHEQLADYTFEINELAPENFDQFMKEKDFISINVTIPYKQEVIPYLDSLDEKAKKIGAVNTIENKDGKLIGYNTDYYGFWWMLTNNNIHIKNKKVAILGNGGATQACKVVIHDMDAKECLIISRTESDTTITYEELFKNHYDVEVLINATPVGMQPKHDDSPIDLSKLKNLESVVDIIYNPGKTKLVLQAESLGITAIGGLEMLVAQAKQAVEIFTGKLLDDEVIKRITNNIQRQKENIVFIGMPSSGKTTLAKMVSDIYHMPFIDLDEEIVRKASKTIPEIFALDGEATFRDIESSCVLDVCMKEGCVISTGGGVIKREKNIEHLKKKGYLIWLDRDVSLLQYNGDRPLVKNADEVKKLYEERLPLYQKYCDVKFDNNGTVDESINKLKQLLESRKIK